MECQVRDALVGELESGSTDCITMDELARSVLVATLEMDKNVFDAMNGKGGSKEKGKSRKETTTANGEDYRAEDPSKCWKHGNARKVLREQEKARSRNRARLNPQPTEDLEREFDLDRELREVGWDIGDTPDSPAETESLQRDMENLRREAGMKKLDSSFAPYAAYLQKWADYKDACKHAMMLHKQAAISLKRHNYDDVEEMIETLKKKPQAILDSYQGVIDAYEDCCSAICDEIDKQGNERGLKSSEALDAEKKEYGMMNRESSKDYQKRMKTVGRSKEVPESIKKIDDIVARTENRWRSVAGMGPEEFAVVKNNFRKTVENLMKGCSLATNRGIMGINGVLESHLKSQHDFVKKGEKFNNGSNAHYAIVGGLDSDPRYKFSRKCFGVDKGLKPSQYEKYGCLHTGSPAARDNLMGGQYGKNVIRWKPHKAVATMSFTDSLCLARDGLNYVNPCLVTNPSPCCFNPENKEVVEALKKRPLSMGLEELCYLMGAPYCELQLHGEDQYNASAIESISFGSENDVKNLSKPSIESILSNHIPIYIRDKRIEIDEQGRIKTGNKK